MPQKEKERMLHHPFRKEAETTVEHGIKRTLEPEKFDLAIDTQLLVDHETWKWWLLRYGEFYFRKITLDMPIIVLASEDDPVITLEIIQERVIKELKGAKLITTKGVGHLIPLEAPKWLAEQIRKILKKSLT